MTNAVEQPGAEAAPTTDKIGSSERGWRAGVRAWVRGLVARSQHGYARGRPPSEGEARVRCPQCNRLFSEDERTCPHDGAPLASLDALVGSEVDGRYRVTGRIGQGGMGTVYRAIQLSVGRSVAIKVLSAEVSTKPEVVARFETEARVISRLQHPCTLKLFDFGRLPDGRLFLVTELLQGRSLAGALLQGPLPAQRVVNILDQICRALTEAHNSGVVHRDLKPDNIFLQNVGSEEVVKVLDFGIAKVAAASSMAAHRTATGKVFGTPWYMSPEQARGGPIDGRGDLYSLGVVAYECLTGRVPFQEPEPWAVIMKHLMEDPRPLCEVRPGCATPELQDLVLELLEKLPEDRPQSPEAVRARLASMSERLPLATSELDMTAPASPIDEAREAELAARGEPASLRPVLTGERSDAGPVAPVEISDLGGAEVPTPAEEGLVPDDAEPVRTRDLLPGGRRRVLMGAGGVGGVVALVLLLPRACDRAGDGGTEDAGRAALTLSVPPLPDARVDATVDGALAAPRDATVDATVEPVIEPAPTASVAPARRPPVETRPKAPVRPPPVGPAPPPPPCAPPVLVITLPSKFPGLSDRPNYTVSPSDAKLESKPSDCVKVGARALGFARAQSCSVRACVTPKCCSKWQPFDVSE